MSELHRPGDIARIEENVTESSTRKRAGAKAKKSDPSEPARRKSAEGVVYRVAYSQFVVSCGS